MHTRLLFSFPFLSIFLLFLSSVSLCERTCSTIKVGSGDSCPALASRCGISPADFTKYNPGSNLCSSLIPGQHVCCGPGSLPDFAPKPFSNGTCYTYKVQKGDSCSGLAAANSVTIEDIESYNNNTWGWKGCSKLEAKQNICLSNGVPPFPAPLENAICGPQVPGTTQPDNSTNWALLNPCPLNACCDIWGRCGITPEFCENSGPDRGAPGTSNCISNCGTNLTNNSEPPKQFFRIGYFEGYDTDRDCLAMKASQLPTSYSHIHFAFGAITDNYQVDLSKVKDQFTEFVSLSGFKRILSFGGWSFSTSQDSYPIFRQAVTPAQRQSFAQSVVSTVKKYDLDGVDFDWEYPGASDIPGVPPGSPEDGTNYLAFLKELRSVMPGNKTISIAAPASYWYLKGFPIKDMAPVVDYIVYMTYDLHGQWDYNNTFSNPGCPDGNCLRSQ